MAGKRIARRNYVLVASGDGARPWRLYWPRDKWDQLSPEEQAATVARQRALFEGAERESKRENYLATR